MIVGKVGMQSSPCRFSVASLFTHPFEVLLLPLIPTNAHEVTKVGTEPSAPMMMCPIKGNSKHTHSAHCLVSLHVVALWHMDGKSPPNL